MKYIELLEELKKLTSEQLQQTARVAGEDVPMFEIGGTWIPDEDHIDPSGDGIEPISSYAGDPDFNVSEEPVCVSKGTVILMGKDL